MSWQTILGTVAQAVANALGGAPPSASAPTPPSTTIPTLTITATGLTAFVDFAGPIVRIVEGKGTLTDDEAAANAVLDAIATFDPAGAPVISLIQMAEPTFGAIVGLVKAGKITGGYPDIIGEENSINFKNR